MSQKENSTGGNPFQLGMVPTLPMLEDFDKMVKSRPQVKDRIEQLLPAGPEYMLVCGRTGLGKTNLLLQLAMCLTTGSHFLGFKVEPCGVAYIGFEGTQDKLNERLAKIQVNFPKCKHQFRPNILPPMKVNTRQGQGEFLKLVEPLKGAVGVVLLDPVKYMVSGDYIKPDIVRQFTTALREVITSLGMNAIVSHHIRKKDPRGRIEPGDLDQVKGAADYVEAANTVLLLETAPQSKDPSTGQFKPKNPDDLVLYIPKHRDAIESQEPIPITFNRNKLLFEQYKPPIWGAPKGYTH